MRDFTLDEIKDLVPVAREMNPTGDAWLDGRFRWEAETSHQPKPCYKMFWLLAQHLRPDFVVELGAWRGIGAAHFAAGGALKVATVDHHSDPGDDVNRDWCLETVQRYPNLHYLQGWTWEWQVIDRVAHLGPIDILYIDSWHVYDKAVPDWLIYSRLLADRALVICDDLADIQGTPIAGMEQFWHEMPGYPGDPQALLDVAQAQLDQRGVTSPQRLAWDQLPGRPWQGGTADKWLAGTALNTYPMGFMKLERDRGS